MSEPPNTPATMVESHQEQSHRHLPLVHGGATPSTTAVAGIIPGSLVREYRKGNWTLQETLVLITAKRLDDERRIRASSTPPDPTGRQQPSPRTGELRWKWVENYCWNHGCQRSQNQCNDKWDNLLRDYKKVREYELRSQSDGSTDLPSYWAMDKQERKDRNLPSNMASEVYEALKDVVQKRHQQRTTATASASASASSHLQQPQTLPAQPQPLAIHPPQPPPPPEAPPPAVSETSESSGTESSEKVESESKRRKMGEIGSSIMRSSTVLARTIRSCEEMKEKRHREVMEMEERRLRLQESRNEVNRQGIAALIASVNNLSAAIQSLIPRHPHHPT